MFFFNGKPESAFRPSIAMPTNLAAWWRADMGVTLVSGAVSQWADQVSGRKLVQATASKRPVMSTVRGQASILFDGTDDWLQSDEAPANWKALHNGSGCTISIVWRKRAITAYGQIIGTCNTTGGVATATGLALNQNAAAHYPYWDCGRANATATFTTPDLTTMYMATLATTLKHKTGGSPYNYNSKNGGQCRVGAYAAAASASNPDYTLTLGAEPAAKALPANIDVCEIIVWTGYNTDVYDDILETYYAERYGMSFFPGA